LREVTAEGDERDVRDVLARLEGRLLDLERELREDAGDERSSGAPPSAPSAPAPVAPALPPPAPAHEPPPAGDPEVARLAAEAQRKLAVLRESLDGLERAGDRLRETAQTMVEDHGRTLVRLERSGAVARGAGPGPARVESVAPAEPTSTAAPQGEPDPRSVPDVVPVASAPAAPTPPAPAAPTPPVPAAPTPPAPAAPGADRRPRPRGWLPWAVGLAVIAVVGVIALLVLSGGADPPSGVSVTQRAFSTAGGGFSTIPGLRSGRTAAVQRDVCAGRLAAGIDLRAPTEPAWNCPGVVAVASVALQASGFARQTRRGRSCFSLPSVPVLQRRRDARLTALRDEVVRSSPRDRAYAAGAAFDRRARLTVLAAARVPGGPCVVPDARTLSDGSYPLLTRLTLYARRDAASSAEVRRAASGLRRYFAGLPPLYAVVLRR
jgi:hypothetical protein